MFIKTFLTVAVVCFTSPLANVASANTVIRNESNETIKAHVLLTFIAKDGLVYQRRIATLRPGQKHTFDTGAMNTTRVVYLFIHSQTKGKMFFNFKCKNAFKGYNNKTCTAPFWKRPFDSKGNKFIAMRTAQGNFGPLRKYMKGSVMLPALRIQPTSGSTHSFNFSYRGYNSRFITQIRN